MAKAKLNGGFEGWADQVFTVASSFRLHRFHNKGGCDQTETNDFGVAMRLAHLELEAGRRVMVYACAESGRSVLLEQKLWNHFAELWTTNRKQ